MGDSGWTRENCDKCGLGQRLADRCPSCGAQTLFIGSGGWLTCSVIGCKSPSVSTTIGDLREAAAARPILDKLIAIIESDLVAMTHQSMGQYRSALLAIAKGRGEG